MFQKPVCDIIIPIWNLPKKTKSCLESVVHHTSVPYQLVLIDNASEAPTREFLLKFQEIATCPVTLILNEDNLGNVKAANQGIRVSRAEYVCILDNDTVVFPGWLDKMIEAAQSRKEIGIVNPGSNSLGFRKPWYLSWTSFADQVARQEEGRVVEMGTATGFCMLIKRAVIDRIGGWCEDYGMGYYEDRDYSRRAAQEGFVSVLVREAFVYHEEHASFRKLWSRKPRETFRNRELFESRFGASQRIAYCLSQPNHQLQTRIRDEIVQLVRSNHWVWIFAKGNSHPFNLPEHANVKLGMLPSPFFLWNCLIRVLKKKKRFHRIYSDDPQLIRRLKWFQPIHRAEWQFLKN